MHQETLQDPEIKSAALLIIHNPVRFNYLKHNRGPRGTLTCIS